jgi:hypothetical protein
LRFRTSSSSSPKSPDLAGGPRLVRRQRVRLCVGGSRGLIGAILDSLDLEAWEVDPDVSLQADADKINPVPDPPPGFNEPQDPDELQRSFVTQILKTLGGPLLHPAVNDSGVFEVEIGRRGQIPVAPDGRER